MRSPASTALAGWELEADDGTVTPVQVPGTVTQAHPEARDADERVWVFRTLITTVPPGPLDLVLDGVATSYEVVLDGTVLAVGRSMYATQRIDVTSLLHKGSVLEIRCLPLATALPDDAVPRARWRTRLVEDNSLRLIRTTLLGRCPGIAPGPPVVGPWRPVRLETRVPSVRLRTRVEGVTGVLEVSCDADVTVSCAGVSGPPGELRLPDVALWWPHTHGSPALHDVTVTLGGVTVLAGRVGFRTLANTEPSSLDLLVNGVPVWARGAVWTPPGLLAGLPESPRETVRLAREAGMNLLRVPGIAPYESAEFFDACDELGILVWHDLALANLDVPHALLHDELVQEVNDLLDRTGGRPSLAVVCGGSETAQQVAMMGLDPDLWRSDFLDVEAPALVGDQAVWVANSPVGGDLPFRVGAGITHYYGVGGYRRPLSDVRASGVLFAAESLAFANPSPGEFVPRDNGSDWDFADVRDHYARLLDRPSEAVVGELMEHVLGEWRRAASPNRGALVMWLRDLHAGAGWGVLDMSGTPKPPWWHLRRSLAPQAVWLTDEGLDGVLAHLSNDRPSEWSGTLRVALYRADDVLLEQVSVPLSVPAHGSWTGSVEGLLGHFVDVSWAYRFGAPSVAAVVATMEDGSTAPPQAFCFPVGRPSERLSHDVLSVERDGSALVLTSSRLLDGVWVQTEGLTGDNAFCLEPGRARRVPDVAGSALVTALNLDGTVGA
jgi:beta-mannosidase